MQQTSSFLSPEFLSNYEDDNPRNKGRLFKVTHLNKYAWWLEDEKRRETWKETCTRVVNYNVSLYQGPASVEGLRQEAELMFHKIYHLEAEPAGRTLRIGGTEASYKFPEMNFNCAFAVIDSIQKILDIFHLSLCSVGTGFRTLISDVAKIPLLADDIQLVNLPYETKYPASIESTLFEFIGYEGKYPTFKLSVGDSKEGWVKALGDFLFTAADYPYFKIIIDYSHIRPKGVRIKTSGGFAAGHKGLEEMFNRLVTLITINNGRLRPIHAMDKANIIAKNVVTGGNRRAAQINLMSVEDTESISAKFNLYKQLDNGKWVVDPELEHRKMSNNSVTFLTKPDFDQLSGIFEYIKNNGEPGFFNLEAARKRRPNCEGINPCITVDTWISTTNGPRQVKDLTDAPYDALINGVSKAATAFWSSGVKPVYRLNTKEGYQLKLTADHKVLTTEGWVEAQYLTENSHILLNNLESFEHEWSGSGSFKEGWLIGSLIGDGTFTAGRSGNSKTDADLRFWGRDQQVMAEKAFSFMNESVKSRSDVAIVRGGNGYLQVGSVGISDLAAAFDIVMGDKHKITPKIEKASSDFYKGFLQGLFDADGSPQGSVEKGRSVRLAQSNVEFLRGVQRMLLRLGMKSTLYENRKDAGFRLMPNGKGGLASYFCRQLSELVIARDSMYKYAARVGFGESSKQERLNGFISSNNTRRLYKDHFIARFSKLEYLGEEEVFDCAVENLHRFDANGLIVHNCAEICLDDMGVCNLSTVVMTSHLYTVRNGWEIDLESLEASVRLATRIGMRQTNVTLSLPEWDRVQKRDRLTGVSFTGWMDAMDKWTRGWSQPESSHRWLLDKMGKWANEEADKYAYEMRIPRPLLVTAIKPEGTISQLPTCSSGLHRAFAPYYIRRMSISKTDPLNKALKFMGSPWEVDTREENPTRDIFLFPVETGANSTAYNESAINQLKRYILMQKVYTDHNSSCTIYVGSGRAGFEDEWEEVIKFVYENWDDIVAISFLPKHSLEKPPFPQMPYEYCTKAKHDEMLKSFPNLDKLGEVLKYFEQERTEFQEDNDACVSGVCPSA